MFVYLCNTIFYDHLGQLPGGGRRHDLQHLEVGQGHHRLSCVSISRFEIRIYLGSVTSSRLNLDHASHT